VSNGEDRNVRVWDLVKQVPLTHTPFLSITHSLSIPFNHSLTFYSFQSLTHFPFLSITHSLTFPQFSFPLFSIVSNSEDRSVRVWDLAKQAPPVVVRRDHDRYWILDAHPTLCLLAAGHDSGLFVFKLHRERPPFDVTANALYYYKVGTITLALLSCLFVFIYVLFVYKLHTRYKSII
jgi:WD40 repeat protein